MKKGKKALALLLILTLVLILAACGGKSDIIGTWQGEVDLSEAFIEGADEGSEEVIDSMGLSMELDRMSDYLEPFTPLFTYVFNEDGTYSVKVDEASLDAEMEEYKQGLEAYFRYFFVEMLSQMAVEMGLAEQVSSEEELESVLDIDLEEAISEGLGMELSAFVDELVREEMGSTQEIAALFNSEGKYKTQDGKLLLSAGLEYDVDPEIYDYYSISGTTLTITEGTPSEDDELITFYPLVLEKVA